MKLEQPLHPSLAQLHKEHFPCGSNFKEKFPSHLKEINLTAKLPDQDPPKKHPNQVEKSIKFNCQKNKLPSDISTLLQTGVKIYYFLGRKSIQNYSEIVIYEYLKQDGKHESMELSGIKGVIMAMKAKFCPRRRINQKNSDQFKPAKRSQSSSKQQNVYEVVLLLGTQSGHLKTIRFNDIESSPIQNRSSIQNLKLDHTPLIDIAVLQPKHYSNANVCLVLSMTNHVYLVNFDYMTLLAMLVPSIVNCEVGLSLSVNHERHYFVQASQGGYIIFWEIDENVQNLIKVSHGTTQSEKNQDVKTLPAKTEYDQNDKTLNSSTFKPSQIHHCISPVSLFHSSTITGLKHCELYGNLLLIVTTGGMIKLLAINKPSHNHSHIHQNEFCTLLEYQVQDGELISDVKFFPFTREIFVVKNAAFEGVMEKTGSESFIHVKEYNLQKVSKKKDKNFPTNDISRPYKPIFFKQIKRNLKFHQRPRSKSVGSGSLRCYFERISFNCELDIERVDKVNTETHSMDCIDSIDIVDEKDVVYLRGKDFYLVGETSIFKTIDLV